MKPNIKNFCGGNFQDWLEVYLTGKCNGRCSWCIDKNGFKPKHQASWNEITRAILETGKQNIILLGGEPTLYPDVSSIIHYLREHNKEVYITTNGGKLSPGFIRTNLSELTGINISIHNYDLEMNRKITGIMVKNLPEIVEILHEFKIIIRLNCNCIKGHIDRLERIYAYIDWAKSLKVDKVRFAELKMDDEHFVDLAEVFHHRYGLNDDPYVNGCNQYAEINGMQINFRQMCGCQTNLRPYPKDAEQIGNKKVVYYDGKVYDGWQSKEDPMKKKKLLELLQDVADKKIDVETAADILKNEEKPVEKDLKEIAKQINRQVFGSISSGGTSGGDGGHCQY